MAGRRWQPRRGQGNSVAKSRRRVLREDLTVPRIAAGRIVRLRIGLHRTGHQKAKAEECRGPRMLTAECSGMIRTPTTAEDKGTTLLRKFESVATPRRDPTPRGRRMLVR